MASALPPRILLDYATRCNLRCPMCPVWGQQEQDGIDAVTGQMSPQAIKQLLGELSPAAPLIQPSLYGEPLLIPHFRDRIRELQAAGCTIALNTNGLGLNHSICEFLVQQAVDSVFISIDAATAATFAIIRGIDRLEQVEAGALRLLAARGTALLPRIGVSFVKQTANTSEEQAFIQRWLACVDCVRIGLMYDSTAGTYPDMQPPTPRQPCPVLWHTLPIHNDGTASICCLDGMRQATVGNVFQQGLAAVWQGAELERIRQLHLEKRWDEVPLCRNCNGWAQHLFQEEVDASRGLLIRRSPQLTYYNRLDRLHNWQGRLQTTHQPAAMEA